MTSRTAGVAPLVRHDPKRVRSPGLALLREERRDALADHLATTVAEARRTCPRCDGTRQQITRAIARLRDSLKPLAFEPVPEVREIDVATSRKNPGEFNRIWIAGRPMEEWPWATTGSSQCCSVCGDAPCRATELDGTAYEQVPQEVILRGAFMAAFQLLTPQPCECEAPGECCPG